MRHCDSRHKVRRQRGLIVPSPPRRGYVCLPLPMPLGNVGASGLFSGNIQSRIDIVTITLLAPPFGQ